MPSARKKNQAGCVSCHSGWRSNYMVSSQQQVAGWMCLVSHALSANSRVGEYDGLHTFSTLFSTLSVISGKVARDSRKLKLRLKSVDGFYAGKSGF
ncbi:hypothetical protein ACFX15_031715 [Malus domestica]